VPIGILAEVTLVRVNTNVEDQRHGSRNDVGVKLIESVDGRQVFVAVAQMVLTEVACGITTMIMMLYNIKYKNRDKRFAYKVLA
jgi:hypothetical protein